MYVTYVRVLFLVTVVHWSGSWLICPLWLYWFSYFLAFRWMGWGGGGGGGVPAHSFFVVRYCFLFWIGCDLSNSAIMKSDLLCSVVRD